MFILDFSKVLFNRTLMEDSLKVSEFGNLTLILDNRTSKRPRKNKRAGAKGSCPFSRPFLAD